MTFQPLLVEFMAVFKVFPQNRVRRSGLHRRSLTFLFLVVVFFCSPQGSLPEQSTAKLTASQFADIPVPGLGGSGCLLGSLPGQGSPASPGPDHVDEHVPDSAEWVLFRASATDRPFYWNRRTNATAWKPPPGINVVWVGERPEGGVVWYWHKGTRASTYDLPPLPPE